MNEGIATQESSGISFIFPQYLTHRKPQKIIIDQWYPKISDIYHILPKF